jgi:hypothetical protein
MPITDQINTLKEFLFSVTTADEVSWILYLVALCQAIVGLLCLSKGFRNSKISVPIVVGVLSIPLGLLIFGLIVFIKESGLS